MGFLIFSGLLLIVALLSGLFGNRGMGGGNNHRRRRSQSLSDFHEEQDDYDMMDGF